MVVAAKGAAGPRARCRWARAWEWARPWRAWARRAYRLPGVGEAGVGVGVGVSVGDASVRGWLQGGHVLEHQLPQLHICTVQILTPVVL